MAALPHSDEALIDRCMLWLGMAVGGSGLHLARSWAAIARSWAALWVDEWDDIGEDVVF